MPRDPVPADGAQVVPIESRRRARRRLAPVPGRWGWDPYGYSTLCGNDIDCPPDKICERGRCV